MCIFYKYYVFILDVKMKTEEIIVGIEQTDNNYNSIITVTLAVIDFTMVVIMVICKHYVIKQ